MKLRSLGLSLVLLAACSASSSSPPSAPATTAGDAGADDAAPVAKTDAEYRTETAQGMHDVMAGDLAQLLQAAKDLQAAAPTPTGRGWDATQDAAAIQAMKDAWVKCRIAYEHVEGAIGAIFPDIDFAIDARYDDFLANLGGQGDADLFDASGVTGMHAVERILYSASIPTRTVDFERTLPGYKPAALPSSEAEAVSFKTKLVQKLIDDVTAIDAQWAPAKIDAGVAFNGLVLLMNEQHEKVNKAATGEEESRYAQVTLFDLRNNLEGTTKAYAVFRPWILAHASSDPAKDGAAADKAIQEGFDKLAKLYATYTGDAIPQPPATWSSLSPSAADLATPFGVLYKSVTDAVDDQVPGTIVSEMNRVADMLGFRRFQKG